VQYERFTKKLVIPPGTEMPTRLRFEDLEARAITRADLTEYVRGINASIELIARTRGGGWPTEPVTEEFNFVDIVWHELEFRDGVTPTAYRRGDYDKLYTALQHWIATEFPFWRPYYSNREIPAAGRH
jgi:hypothetical protein